MPLRSKNRALIYLRRSSGRQEISLTTQLEWAIAEAAKLNVRVDASPEDLDFMQRKHLTSHKSLRIDDAVTGADLTRPGFRALIDNAKLDICISHLLIYRRDRFARPEEAMEMVKIEKQLRQQGITFVMTGKIAGPLERGRTDVGEDISMWMEYLESGEFLIKHAERVITSKMFLAKGGYWAGGRAPYGFVRVLIDAQGNVLEELADGRRVRQQGCHVRIMPKDKVKLGVWVYALDLKHEGWGALRIAKHLTKLGIPSPDAGRTRTDHGVKHTVSGKWSAHSVLELCRNPAILGVVELGRRSDGAHRRLGSEGPRLLRDDDRDANGRAKLVRNSKTTIISSETGFVAEYDATKWAEISAQMEHRGRNQRGIPRVRDLSNYPLSTRVVDLTDGCGAIMYARTSGKRRLYTCGRYMSSCSAECENNSVDAEALLRLTIHTLRQLATCSGQRDQLRSLLEARAKAEAEGEETQRGMSELAFLEAKQRQLAEDLLTAKRRLAVERDDDRYAAIAEQFDLIKQDLRETEENIQTKRQFTAPIRSIDQEVADALALFDDIIRLTGDDQARNALPELMKRLGVRIGLSFASGIKGTKREIRMLVGGVMTFGDTRISPVKQRAIDNPASLIANDSGLQIASVKSSRFPALQVGTANVSGDCAPETVPPGAFIGHQAGVSYTKVNRGDKI